MESGWISQGPFVGQAEAKLSEMNGRKHVICTSSGTTALLVSLLATTPNFGFSDPEIPVPAFTFAAVHNVVSILGLVRVFLRSDSTTWQVRDERWSRENYAEVVITAANYGKVQGTILADSKTIVINDIAESFGGTLNGFPAGAFGKIACCSFYANKIVTAGEGGAIMTDDIDLALKLKTIVNHGIHAKDYVARYIGLNGRMTDLQAAVLCAQLDRMPQMIRRRRDILAEYRRAAAGRPWTFPEHNPKESPAPWLFAGIHTDIASVQRRADAANIEWRPFFPIPKEAGEMKETRFISENGICLPLSSTMTDGEVNRVCEVIRGS
jgi:perosamine synthetase